MCGRYGHTKKKKDQVKKRFRLQKVNCELAPRYNIAPGQDVPVILNQAPAEMQSARWGLVPFWAKDEKIGYKMINARSETIFDKPAYRSSIRKKRCLIMADFFYEWQKAGTGTKQPFCIRRKNRETFAFAGIWDCFREELISCSIITCRPNAAVEKVHDRMPVILQQEDEEKWLREENPGEIQKLLKPCGASDIETYKISTMVNSPNNDSEDILLPV